MYERTNKYPSKAERNEIAKIIGVLPIKILGWFTHRRKQDRKPKKIIAFHKGEKMLICDNCGKKFGKKSRLEDHIKYVHEKRRDYPCNICGKFLSSKDHVKKHIKDIHEKVKIKCDICGKDFSHRHYLKTHISSVHEGLKKHNCETCGQNFKFKYTLKRHIKNVHGALESDNSLQCDICGKISKDKEAYWNHKYKHNLKNASQNIPCDHCDQIFSHRNLLNDHIKRVRESMFPCTICGKIINSKTMNQHMLAIHSIKQYARYKCEFCEKEFAQKSLLKYHMNSHTGDKPFKCKYCGQGFATPGNKSTHEKSVHKGIKRLQRNKKTVNTKETNNSDEKYI